jgi:DNA-binding NarL/FixJ family response regulator
MSARPAVLEKNPAASDRESPAKQLSCFVADDHPVVLAAICGLLEANGMEVAGRALDGRDALSKIDRRKPSVAVLDLGLPDIGGVEAARIIRTVSPETAVIIYTGSGNVTRAAEALDAGARAVVLKDAPLEDLVRAIKVAASGGRYIDPTLASSFLDSSDGLLSERERSVLGLAADGLSNKQIGDRLFLSGQTVAKYLATAMRKLDVNTRTEAVAIALRQRIIS